MAVSEAGIYISRDAEAVRFSGASASASTAGSQNFAASAFASIAAPKIVSLLLPLEF